MKAKFKHLYMRIANEFALMSYAKRRKVGCVIVIEGILIPGYNGTPEGWDNTCETCDLSLTLPDVIHAEGNALDKLIRSTLSSVGAHVFVTTAPCQPCAMRLVGAKVAAVYYAQVYRSEDGINFLRRAGILVEQIGE